MPSAAEVECKCRPARRREEQDTIYSSNARRGALGESRLL